MCPWGEADARVIRRSIVGVGDKPQSISFVKSGEGDTSMEIPAADTTGSTTLALSTLYVVCLGPMTWIIVLPY